MAGRQKEKETGIVYLDQLLIMLSGPWPNPFRFFMLVCFANLVRLDFVDLRLQFAPILFPLLFLLCFDFWPWFSVFHWVVEGKSGTFTDLPDYRFTGLEWFLIRHGS